MTETDLILQWSVAAIVGLVLLARGQFTPYHPAAIYLVFHVVVFCLRPTLVHTLGFDSIWEYMRIAPEPDHQRLALLISSVALVVLVTSCTLASTKALPLEFGRVPEFDKSDIRALIFTAIVFVPIGVYGLINAPTSGEVVQGVFIPREPADPMAGLHHVLTPIAVLFALAARFSWWGFLPLGACLYFRAEQDWGRWAIVQTSFLFVLVWLWHYGRRLPSIGFVVASAVIIALSVTAAFKRDAIFGWVSGSETRLVVSTGPLILEEHLDAPDFAGFDFLACVVAVVPEQSQAYTHGTQYLAAFTEPVQLQESTQQRPLIGQPVSLAGDGWMSGGWVGLAITMIVVGAALGAGYTTFTRHLESTDIAGAFLAALALVPQYFRDGGPAIAVPLILTIVPFLAWGFLARRMRLLQAVDEERELIRGRRESRRIIGNAIINPNAAPVPAHLGIDDDIGPRDSTLADEVDDELEEDREDDGESDEVNEDDPEEPTPPPSDDGAPPRPQPRWRSGEPR